MDVIGDSFDRDLNAHLCSGAFLDFQATYFETESSACWNAVLNFTSINLFSYALNSNMEEEFTQSYHYRQGDPKGGRPWGPMVHCSLRAGERLR